MSSLTSKIFPTRKIKLSTRLQAIQDAITQKNCIIADVGSDHCHTAIAALANNKAKFAYNIDNKRDPLLNGVKNLTNAGLLSQTKNILADGLQTKEITDKIDYCIISGLGGKKISEIIKTKPETIKINEYIIVVNDDPFYVRKLIFDRWWRISTEKIIKENDYYFHLIKFSTVGNYGKTIQNKNELYLGPVNLIENTAEFQQYIKVRFNNLARIIGKTKNKNFLEEYTILKGLIEKA